jgi:pyruvate,orthophosphate dikinase
MFFEGDRAMILANNTVARKAALKKLLPLQRKDFIGLFKAMKGLPVTIRLLDPPLHEFVPHDATSQKEMAAELGISLWELRRRVDRLHEMNPMLGHRGCRLAVTYPEILDTQVTAVAEAAIHCRNKGIDAQPEIMIPLIGTARELEMLVRRVRATIEAVKESKKYHAELNIPIGTMIEVPRAAVTADEVAVLADFFSFGTNDLTQMTFGFSRDDVNTFLPDYLRQEILSRDPFQSLDTCGVGQLVEIAVSKGRLAKPGLKCGVCGEHGGDPDSIHFFNRAGLNYVSCSPFRVPVARLAAAQAALATANRD